MRWLSDSWNNPCGPTRLGRWGGPSFVREKGFLLSSRCTLSERRFLNAARRRIPVAVVTVITILNHYTSDLVSEDSRSNDVFPGVQIIKLRSD
jgi:hypothetical protein